MAWVIASNRSNSSFALSPRFQILRWQLLGAYLGIMMVINLISNILVYQFFARSLHQQVDQRLQILADSAAQVSKRFKEIISILKNRPNAILIMTMT
jgi:hypothetical protein